MRLSMSKKELLESLQLGVKLGLKQVYVSACTEPDVVIPVIDKPNSLQESVSVEKKDLGVVKELVVCVDKDLGDNTVLIDEDEVLDKVITEEDIFEEVEDDGVVGGIEQDNFEEEEETYESVDEEFVVIHSTGKVVDEEDDEDVNIVSDKVVDDYDEEEEELYEDADVVTISDIVNTEVKKIVVVDEEEEELYEDNDEEFIEIPTKVAYIKGDITSKENVEAVVKKFNVGNIADCGDKTVNIALNKTIEEVKPDAKALKINITGDKITHNTRMTLLEFLRSNPSVNKPDVIEKYYSKAEIRKLIDSGSAFMKGGKIII